MEDSKYDVIIKIVIIGESAVGKTNLLTRYTVNSFDKSAKATIGMDFTSKEVYISGYTAKAQFWDTAGQEKYKAIAKSYYKLADGVLLVYDVTRRETFEKLKNWLNDIKNNSDKEIKIILIGNKNDLVNKRKVSVEEGKKFAQDNDMFFWETSALTNSERCVNKAFDALLEECMKEICQEYENEQKEELDTVRKNTKALDYVDLPKNDEKGSRCCQRQNLNKNFKFKILI